MGEMQLNFGDNLKVGQRIKSIKVDPRLRVRVSTGLKFFDFVLSGETKERGLTPSEVIMFTGSAGAGKTTLLLQMASSLSLAEHEVLVIGNEESAAQMRMTYERLQCDGDFVIAGCHFLDVTGRKDVDDAIYNKRMKVHNTFKTHYEAALERHREANAKRKPGDEKWMVIFVDSLQTMNCGKWGWNVNSKTPERVLAHFCELAKRDFVIFVVIGQVTKGGEFSGKNIVRHMVDAMISLIVDNDDKSPTCGCRLLEAEKHRFGPTGLTAVLDIKPRGLVEHGTYNGV